MSSLSWFSSHTFCKRIITLLLFHKEKNIWDYYPLNKILKFIIILGTHSHEEYRQSIIHRKLLQKTYEKCSLKLFLNIVKKIFAFLHWIFFNIRRKGHILTASKISHLAYIKTKKNSASGHHFSNTRRSGYTQHNIKNFVQP